MKKIFIISALFFFFISLKAVSNPIDTTGLTPLLDWPDSPGATQYRLQISTSPAFTTIVLDISGLTQSQYTVLSGILQCNTHYYWRYKGFIGGTWGEWSTVYEFVTYCPIGIGDPGGSTPKKYYLFQNYPNPFNPATIIKFDIPSRSFVTVTVYDVIGNALSVLVNNELVPGTYEVSFDGSNFSSGIYYYKLEAGEFSSVRKMILIK